jgi:hypothetical protein
MSRPAKNVQRHFLKQKPAIVEPVIAFANTDRPLKKGPILKANHQQKKSA